MDQPTDHSADCSAELFRLSARRLDEGFAAGEFTPVDALEAVLDRLAAVDGELNAFCLVDADAARRDAEAAAGRRRSGTARGPLDGVPVSVKDLLLTAGSPTLRGSRTVAPAGPWTEDAPAVARLREAGAVLFGKTTTPEFGWKGVTDNPLTGVTRNPWDPSATSGGSSGGAAAAVAAGIGPLGIGTDGGGSVRIPAAFCGVFGLKPTYGRIPLHPASPFGTLSHAGPLARSAADAALLLDVVSGPDPRDWSALAPTPPVRLDAGVLHGLRIAYSPTFGGQVEVDPAVAAEVRSAVDVLASLGAEVVEADPPIGELSEVQQAFHVLWFAGAAKVLEPLSAQSRALVDPALQEVAEQGAGFSASEYLDAVDVRMRLGAAMGGFHRDGGHALLATPALPLTAFLAGQETPTGKGRWTDWTPFTYPFNLTQQPAAAIPCGLAGGLPAALQLVGPRHADALVLSASAAVEDAVRPPSTAAPLVV
ncbi:amidase [Mangrovactinospora gilvigrisea]|uniref:Amidase n=1 Tax=Mangrovactinospora gilvigrisea TaxID=1428644 RepID=A0A1J7BIA3_9ACTN|nr:amidase [Mangrovactinospora gilvigrisea]OIV38317.1 amidase [Mangrovactinospora gilvigrisea]